MALRDFKVLTFNEVRTLIDFEGGMPAYLHHAVPDSDLTDEQFLAAYREVRKMPDTDWYPNDLVRCWHVITSQLGLPESDALADSARDPVPPCLAFPHPIDPLTGLHGYFKFFTITNEQNWALQYFQKTQDLPFDMPLAWDNALCERPDLRYIAYARGHFDEVWGYKQSGNLHVMQSQYQGIGVTTCWIERRQGLVGSSGTIESELTVPNHHFHSLAQLFDAVEARQ